jgi:hypothetical protein
VDLSAFPTKAILRWDLALRLLLTSTVPTVLQYVVTGDVLGPAIIAALVGAFVSLSNLGPDIAQAKWVALALIGAPVATVIGVLVGTGPIGGYIFVFVLYVIYGVCLQAGLLAQTAWYPISALGLVAAVLASDLPDATTTGVAAAAGSAWAGLLMLITARIPLPRLPIPRQALTPEKGRFRRIVRHPTLDGWFFPALLGSLSVIVLLVAEAVTSGFKPYWAVFAMVAVLGPTVSKSRHDSWVVAGSAFAGVVLSFIILSLEMPLVPTLALVIALFVLGGLVLVRFSLLARTIITPFPVVVAAAALGEPAGLVLGWRVGQYAVGAGVGLLAAMGAAALRPRIVRAGALAEGEPGA